VPRGWNNLSWRQPQASRPRHLVAVGTGHRQDLSVPIRHGQRVRRPSGRVPVLVTDPDPLVGVPSRLPCQRPQVRAGMTTSATTSRSTRPLPSAPLEGLVRSRLPNRIHSGQDRLRRSPGARLRLATSIRAPRAWTGPTCRRRTRLAHHERKAAFRQPTDYSQGVLPLASSATGISPTGTYEPIHVYLSIETSSGLCVSNSQFGLD